MGSNLTLHKYTNRFYEIHQTKNEEKPASGVPLRGTKTKIQFCVQNRLASPRRGRARRNIFQLAEAEGFEPSMVFQP